MFVRHHFFKYFPLFPSQFFISSTDKSLSLSKHSPPFFFSSTNQIFPPFYSLFFSSSTNQIFSSFYDHLLTHCNICKLISVLLIGVSNPGSQRRNWGVAFWQEGATRRSKNATRTRVGQEERDSWWWRRPRGERPGFLILPNVFEANYPNLGSCCKQIKW